MSENRTNEKRLTDLESSLMHLQNYFEALNEVVLDHANRIEQMAKAMQRMADRLQAVSETEPERDAEDEIPPHY